MNKILKYIILACLSFSKLAANQLTITNEYKHAAVSLLFNDYTSTDLVCLQSGTSHTFDISNRSLKYIAIIIDGMNGYHRNVYPAKDEWNTKHLNNINLRIIHKNHIGLVLEEEQ